jgi:hypothetical protein
LPVSNDTENDGDDADNEDEKKAVFHAFGAQSNCGPLNWKRNNTNHGEGRKKKVFPFFFYVQFSQTLDTHGRDVGRKGTTERWKIRLTKQQITFGVWVYTGFIV